VISRDPASKKFINARGTYRRKRTRCGRAGPSRYSRLGLKALAERLVELEEEHFQLMAGLGHAPQNDRRQAPPKKVTVMLGLKKARVNNRMKVLREVLERLMVERCSADFDLPEVAQLMSSVLGEKVSARTLYREPYVHVVQGQEPDTAETPLEYNDRTERVRRHARQPRAVLIHRLMRIEPQIAALKVEREAALISGAPDLAPLTNLNGATRR
jgi:hypothetical protein